MAFNSRKKRAKLNQSGKLPAVITAFIERGGKGPAKSYAGTPPRNVSGYKRAAAVERRANQSEQDRRLHDSYV